MTSSSNLAEAQKSRSEGATGQERNPSTKPDSVSEQRRGPAIGDVPGGRARAISPISGGKAGTEKRHAKILTVSLADARRCVGVS